MSNFESTKVIELGSCAFRQWRATHSHCRFVHGYQLKAKFWFGCSELDNKNWAIDFGGLKELKAILQDTFDHTWCVAADDPCLPIIKQLEAAGAATLRIFENGVGIERAAEFCYKTANDFLKEKYGNRCWVNKVEVFEHQDNSATYSAIPNVQVTSIWSADELMQPFGISSKDLSKPTAEAIWQVTDDSYTHVTAGDVIDTIASGNVSCIDIKEALAKDPALKEVAEIVEVTPLEVPVQHNPRAAQVGPNTTTGKGDWFGGTSWGKK